MSKRKSSGLKTRDLGLNHGGPGKGDADRTTDLRAYRRNLEYAFSHGHGWSNARSMRAKRAHNMGTACSSDH